MPIRILRGFSFRFPKKFRSYVWKVFNVRLDKFGHSYLLAINFLWHVGIAFNCNGCQQIVNWSLFSVGLALSFVCLLHLTQAFWKECAYIPCIVVSRLSYLYSVNYETLSGMQFLNFRLRFMYSQFEFPSHAKCINNNNNKN